MWSSGRRISLFTGKYPVGATEGYVDERSADYQPQMSIKMSLYNLKWFC